MDFSFSPEEKAFREEFTSWLTQNLPENWIHSNTKFMSPRRNGAGYTGVPKKIVPGRLCRSPLSTGIRGQGKTLIHELMVSEPSLPPVWN